MTGDERIDALTQSVQLLSDVHQDNEKKFTLMFERHEGMLQQSHPAERACRRYLGKS